MDHKTLRAQARFERHLIGAMVCAISGLGMGLLYALLT